MSNVKQTTNTYAGAVNLVMRTMSKGDAMTSSPSSTTRKDPTHGVTVNPKNCSAVRRASPTVRVCLEVLAATHARVTPRLPAPKPMRICRTMV